MAKDYKKAYEEAKANGYSDTEIAQHLSGNDTKYKEALDNGYSDAQIIEHFTGAPLEAPTKLPTHPALQVIKQAVSSALPSSQFNEPIASTAANPVTAALQTAGQTLRDPTRIAASARQPGQMAGQKVEDMTGSKLAGFATEMALDPATYALGPAGRALQKPIAATSTIVGEKVLAPAGEVLSATRIKDIIRLFKNPKEVLFAPTLKKSGKVMGALERQVFNVTDDEARLIAKAGDRATGGSRTVVEGLILQGKERALQAQGVKPTGHMGSYTQEQLNTVKDWASHLSPGELIAGRRGASKLTAKATGREGYIARQDVVAFEEAFVKKGKEHAMKYLAAVKDQANARTRAAFLNILPRNQNMSANALRGLGVIGAAATGNPLAALAAMPITTGLATLGAKGVVAGAKAISPVTQRALPAALLKALDAQRQK